MSNTVSGLRLDQSKAAVGNKKNMLLDFPPVKRALLGLYDIIFKWYYDR
jgi:hypothetical protein